MPAAAKLRDDAAITPANTPVDIFVLDNDRMPGRGELRVSFVQSPTAQGGTATINPGALSVRYTPPAGFVGTDTFAYDADPV